MPPEYFNRLLTESEDFRHYLITSMAYCITEIIHLISQVSFDHLEQRRQPVNGWWRNYAGTGIGAGCTQRYQPVGRFRRCICNALFFVPLQGTLSAHARQHYFRL